MSSKENPEIRVETLVTGSSNNDNPSSPVPPANVHEDDSVYQRKHHSHKLFGLPPYQPGPSGKRNFDYNSKYPNEDPPGEEASENARVWMIYNDEAEIFDDNMLYGFRDTLDSLLVFAALFSAVVTTLLVQTSTTLSPDHAQITTHLLAEQILLLRANGNITAINAVIPSILVPNAVTWSSTDVAVNVLFFVSLSLSLSTALFSILAKQWLTAYAAKIPGTSKDVALTRHFRFVGLQKWKLPEVIGMLPLVLHLSLWVFAAGLLVFVWQQNHAVFYATASVLGITFGLYSITIILPPFLHDCPYYILFLDTLVKSSVGKLWYTPVYGFQWALFLVKLAAGEICRSIGLHGFFRRQSRPVFRPSYWHHRRIMERYFSRHPWNLCQAVIWLFDYSSNSTISQAAVKSLAGILPDSLYAWCRDSRTARALTENHEFLETIWNQLRAMTLPKYSMQLQSTVLPSSPMYNPWVRADRALYSWSYYWHRRNMLSEPPLWVTHRPMAVISHSLGLKEECKNLVEYIADCDDMWDPTTKKWTSKPLDWDQTYAPWMLSPLQMMGTHGSPDLVEPVSQQADVNGLVTEDNSSSYTPVGFAACRGHIETVKAFVAVGADLTRGVPPLCLACQLDEPMKLVEYLLEQPEVLEMTGKERTVDHSPVYHAIKAGNTRLVRLLIDKGIQVSLDHRKELKSITERLGEPGQEIMDVLDRAWLSEEGTKS